MAECWLLRLGPLLACCRQAGRAFRRSAGMRLKCWWSRGVERQLLVSPLALLQTLPLSRLAPCLSSFTMCRQGRQGGVRQQRWRGQLPPKAGIGWCPVGQRRRRNCRCVVPIFWLPSVRSLKCLPTIPVPATAQLQFQLQYRTSVCVVSAISLLKPVTPPRRRCFVCAAATTSQGGPPFVLVQGRAAA